MQEIKQLLQRYFDGVTTTEEDNKLKAYFKSEHVAGELKKYTGFFYGMSELPGVKDNNIENDIMDQILEHETKEKAGYRRLYIAIAGIAASLVIIIGGILLRQQQQPFRDTFDNPETAYAYATETLAYVSKKYTSGMEGLSYFEKIEDAVSPLKQGLKSVNEYYDEN